MSKPAKEMSAAVELGCSCTSCRSVAMLEVAAKIEKELGFDPDFTALTVLHGVVGAFVAAGLSDQWMIGALGRSIEEWRSMKAEHEGPQPTHAPASQGRVS